MRTPRRATAESAPPAAPRATRGSIVAQSRHSPLVTALACITLAIVAPATASAAPMVEVEPNDSALHASGPFGPDGWTSTINVSDDIDYVLFRLQGRRQVSLSFSGLNNQCGVTLLNGSDFLQVTDADGQRIASISAGSNATTTSTWTTPRDATEYLGWIVGGVGCQSLLTVAPADALITRPLPAPSFNRTLNVTTVGPVGQSSQVPITAAGTAADEDRVAVLWTTGGCPAAPDESRSDAVLGAKLAEGA